MKNKRLLIIGILLAFSEVSFSTPESSNLSESGSVFEGLNDLSVLIEGFGPNEIKSGISEEELKSVIELKLRQNRIRVRNANTRAYEGASIYININLVYLEKIDHFVYSVDVALLQAVKIVSNDNWIVAKTWSKGTTGINSANDIKQEVLSAIDSRLVIFLNSYLEANTESEK